MASNALGNFENAWRFWVDMQEMASLAAGKPIGERIFPTPHDRSWSASENLRLKRWENYFECLHRDL